MWPMNKNVGINGKSTLHTLDEWYHHNKIQYNLTQNRGVHAEKLIEECGRAQDRAEEILIRKRNETEWLLKGRIEDINFVRQELETIRKSLQEELEALNLLQERIQDEIKCVRGNACGIVEKCIQFRKGRLGIDLIHDEVENELEIEKKKIIDAGILLDKTLEEAKESKRNIRASLYLLNKDVKDKFSCLAIENECLNLRKTNPDIHILENSESIDKANVTVAEWARYSAEILRTSEKKIRTVKLFQSNVKILLEEITNDLKNQYNLVNEVFQRRILELKEAKAELETLHCEIAWQVNNMKLNIDNLKKSIKEKECFLALAQTRLEKRMTRPGIELVRDPAEASLVDEILQIKDSVSELEKLLSEAEKNLRGLLETQIHLAGEINLKTNSIKIDEVDCLTIRQSINYHWF